MAPNFLDWLRDLLREFRRPSRPSPPPPLVGTRPVRIQVLPPQPGVTIRLDGAEGTVLTNNEGWARIHAPADLQNTYVDVSGPGVITESFHGFVLPEGVEEALLTVQLTLYPTTPPPPPPPPRPRVRIGLVTRAGKVLQDGNGPFNAVLVSFFWLLWGLKEDRSRTLKNLDTLAQYPIDGVRIFAEVGEYTNDSWSDRVIDTAWAPFMMQDALEQLWTRRLRALVTLIADPNSRMHNEAAMTLHTDRILAACASRPEAILNMGVGNEWIHGGHRSNLDLLRRLGQRVEERSPFLVSLVSDIDEFDILAGRTERKITGDGGVWDHTEQPYNLKDTLRIASDEEPIGPDSSIAADDDPLRHTAHAVCAWVCRAPIYCYHPGAGIRGGGHADLARNPPRKANFFDEPTLAETLGMLCAARDFLPADLASFGEVSHTHPRFEGIYPFATGPLQPLNPEGFLKSYATRKEHRFAGVFLKVEEDIPLEAPAALTLRTFDLRDDITEVSLERGETHVVRTRGAFAYVGEYR